MLNQLAAEDSATALERRLRRLCRPRVLIVDEVGYLAYGARHADLLFEVVSRRYDVRKPIVITTNRPFREWNDTFPNATCVVTLVDRLVHRSEIVTVKGKSYRLKESQEQSAARKRAREVSE
jgi:DNA replication protein DnaC